MAQYTVSAGTIPTEAFITYYVCIYFCNEIEAGLWIRIIFLRIRIQLFISIRIQQLFKNGSSLTKFVTN